MKFAKSWIAVAGLVAGSTVAAPKDLAPARGASASVATPFQVDVFAKGQDGINTYRIPSILVSRKGTVLAFCEGRKSSAGDTGEICLVLRRSFDGGSTWQPLQVVWDDGANTCGNPTAVVDRDTGTIWMAMTHNLGRSTEKQIESGSSEGTRTVWIAKSDDDGATWSKPIEITRDVKKPSWTWYGTGEGVGIQTRSGRLVIPGEAREAGTQRSLSLVFFSDDHGTSWRLGGTVGDTFGESQVVELADGSLMLNMRNHDVRVAKVGGSAKSERGVALSHDGGLTWSEPYYDPALVEPRCQASILRYSRAPEQGRNLLLFSNPASSKERVRMTVRVSYDEGKTWPHGKIIHAGPSSYSCLTVLPGGLIGCLYERGERRSSEKITFARFSLAWLTDGQD